MKLETLLTESEFNHLNDLVAQAHQAGAGVARMYIEDKGVVLIGITAGDQLLTWFASPAHSLTEALVVEQIVLAGIQTAARLMDELSGGSAQAASSAIKKAASMH